MSQARSSAAGADPRLKAPPMPFAARRGSVTGRAHADAGVRR
jgi:hypothetical protein